jgi:hypothetical protein
VFAPGLAAHSYTTLIPRMGAVLGVYGVRYSVMIPMGPERYMGKSGLEKRAQKGEWPVRKGWEEHGRNLELSTHIPDSMKDGSLPDGWMVKKAWRKIASAINTGGTGLLRGQLSALKKVQERNTVKEQKPKLPKLKPLPIAAV